MGRFAKHKVFVKQQHDRLPGDSILSCAPLTNFWGSWVMRYHPKMLEETIIRSLESHGPAPGRYKHLS